MSVVIDGIHLQKEEWVQSNLFVVLVLITIRFSKQSNKLIQMGNGAFRKMKLNKIAQ